MINSYKVVLCGKTGVGKTSIFKRITGKELNTKENQGKTTNEHECCITVKVDNVDIQLNVLDTLGLEQYAQMTRSYFRGSQAVLIVYSGDDKDSLDQAANCFNYAKIHSVGACFILIRNKIDLESNITDDETTMLFPDHVFTLQFRTSAKTGEGIQTMVQSVASHLQKQTTSAKSGGCTSPQNVDVAPDASGLGFQGKSANKGLVNLNIEEVECRRRRWTCCFTQ